MSGSRIWNNWSANTGSAGGGLSVRNGGQLTIDDSEISWNIASQDGGGIYLYQPNGLVDFYNVELSKNIADTGQGGGLFANLVIAFTGFSFMYERGTLYNNVAHDSGSDIQLTKTGTSTLAASLTNLYTNATGTTSVTNKASVIGLKNNGGLFGVYLLHISALDIYGVPSFIYAEGSGVAGYNTSVLLFNSILENFDSCMTLFDYDPGGALSTELAYSAVSYINHYYTDVGGTPSHNVHDNHPTTNLKLDADHCPMEDSPARDAGVYTFVLNDIRGLRRDLMPDAGAWEFVAHRMSGPLPLLLR